MNGPRHDFGQRAVCGLPDLGTGAVNALVSASCVKRVLHCCISSITEDIWEFSKSVDEANWLCAVDAPPGSGLPSTPSKVESE